MLFFFFLFVIFFYIFLYYCSLHTGFDSCGNLLAKLETMTDYVHISRTCYLLCWLILKTNVNTRTRKDSWVLCSNVFPRSSARSSFPLWVPLPLLPQVSRYLYSSILADDNSAMSYCFNNLR